MLYSGATALGSTAGCFVLYTIARKGGEAFLRRRFSEAQIERGLGLFRRHGLLAVIVPAMLPPPTPFKLFVLLAGLAGVRPVAFTLGIAIALVVLAANMVANAWQTQLDPDRRVVKRG